MFANFNRCFVENSSQITALLTALTKKNAPWKWGEMEYKSFNKLKYEFASKLGLAQLDPELETILEADSSGFAVGRYLSQVDNL